MPNHYSIKSTGRSSMLRRKVHSATSDTEPVSIGLTINKSAEQLGGVWITQGVLWTNSENNQRQVLVLNHETLMSIRDVLNKMSNDCTLKPVTAAVTDW